MSSTSMRSTRTLPTHIGWAGAVGVHARRVLRRWTRSPASILSSVAMPILMLVVLHVMFSGMVEQFSGAPMDMAAVSVMIAVSQAFIAALMGAGSIVQERHDGLPNRLATLPAHPSSSIIGRILGESVISFVAMIAAVAVGLAYGADHGSAAGLLGILAVLAVSALVAGAVGVMLGYLVDSPQGAVSFAPLVMAAMFFNTAMMPREMYAPVLRPVVDLSPVTAVTELTAALADGRPIIAEMAPFAAWAAGLIVLSLVVLSRRAVVSRR
ncbi:MAG: ABC transporter permease [Brachybacterium sp.]|uniref:ABC transporter permease n=1 Tax=Brachybacterium sp. AOP35-5H-19 TaxID=3457685 RepID=UPI003FE7F301